MFSSLAPNLQAQMMDSTLVQVNTCDDDEVEHISIYSQVLVVMIRLPLLENNSQGGR